MKSLGVVLARGASNRLPRKNVRPLAGQPLVAWTCRAAMASRLDRVVLSTEDPEIAQIGREQGIDVPFLRPTSLAEDFARDVDIVLHAVDACQEYYGETYDVVVMIQATTPFVRPEQFDACVRRLETNDLACVFAAREVHDHPRWAWAIDANGEATPYMHEDLTPEEQHSQNLPAAYFPTGAAWAVRVAAMREQNTVYCRPLGFIEVPWELAVDIDNERDWIIAEAVARHYELEPTNLEVARRRQAASLEGT